MVHGGVSWPELEAAHVTQSPAVDWQHEDAEDVTSFGRQPVRLGHRDDEIGLGPAANRG